jgi:hypothetical protein
MASASTLARDTKVCITDFAAGGSIADAAYLLKCYKYGCVRGKQRTCAVTETKEFAMPASALRYPKIYRGTRRTRVRASECMQHGRWAAALLDPISPGPSTSHATVQRRTPQISTICKLLRQEPMPEDEVLPQAPCAANLRGKTWAATGRQDLSSKHAS